MQAPNDRPEIEQQTSQIFTACSQQSMRSLLSVLPIKRQDKETEALQKGGICTRFQDKERQR